MILVDQSEVNGPFVFPINNKDLQVDWEGGSVEEDVPGWSIAATGAGLYFTPAVEVGVCILVARLAAELFDDKILWATADPWCLHVLRMETHGKCK